MTGADAPPIAVAILAAGASTRLGRPKQLVPWRGTTLLHHAARSALDAAVGPVWVILGSEAERCAAALAGLDVRVFRHDGWSEGMGSTIRVAAEAALSDPGIGAVLVMTCDQPEVAADDLRRLAEEYRRSGAAVVASAYAGTVGIPALFGRSQFEVLAALRGDQGARSVLAAQGDRLVSVPCEAAAFDVDTERDIG
jgi:CTP:molybdopterin cytidylyltransferase MocA